jgi:hypothetical protein
VTRGVALRAGRGSGGLHGPDRVRQRQGEKEQRRLGAGWNRERDNYRGRGRRSRFAVDVQAIDLSGMPDSRQMPTDLYIQAEREADADWRAGPSPKKIELREVTSTVQRSLPVAVAPRSVWDIMEKYFYSVEELWKGVDVGDAADSTPSEGGPCWWLAWRVGEFKRSAFYTTLMEHYGRSDHLEQAQ